MERRNFLPLMAMGAVGALLGYHPPELNAQTRQPNVVLILADDLGAMDLGCYGSKDLKTPNLDALAKSGVRFKQFYVASPVCSPSRAALLTGRYPQLAGVPGNVTSTRGTSGGLPSKEVTIAETLKAAGYKTAMFGKWHLGMVPGNEPLDQGFDEFLGHLGGCIDNYSHYFYWGGPNRHDLWKNRDEYWEEGVFFSDIIVREASRFMEQNRNNPFFLYLPFNVPHYPEQAKEKFRGMYRDMEMPRKSYAAFVSTLDDSIGDILRKIDQLGLRDNTLVIFLSDNGYSTEERAFFGGGNSGLYRGAKFSLFEGGVRLPCIARMPGIIPENQVRHQLVTSLDWYPTIASLCGARLPENKIIGCNILPVIKSADSASPHKVFYWQLGKQWSVREGDWKLIQNPVDTDRSQLKGDDAFFLVNLAEDVSERTNLASSFPEKMKHLTEIHDQWTLNFAEEIAK
jgi:arylsulfatase A